MIKIKINEKEKFVKKDLKYKNYTALEAIILLDTAVDILKDDLELSDEDICDLLKEYRHNLKEVNK